MAQAHGAFDGAKKENRLLEILYVSFYPGTTGYGDAGV